MTTHVETEIASQPSCWRRAAEIGQGGPAGLPLPGERVAVVGCGTSFFIAQAYAWLREAAGQGETDAFAASEMPAGRRYDRIVALTRSGTTTEVIELLEHATVPTTAITGDPNTPIMKAADELVVLDFADEQSVVQTRFATTALALLRAHLGEDLGQAIADAEQAVSMPLPAGATDRTQFTFLGTGWTVGLAAEAALKMREASLSWTESYPAKEYRHGPIAISDARSATWLFGPAPDGLQSQTEATGALWIAPGLDPLASLVLVQRLAIALAAAKGLNPDTPRNLTRSVILR